ncbi:hypothetical protein GCM10010495_48650 [Kitasatospora herbaricolor]|uniref:hypothetical protein n=1 Tax=Kitasatospora herbaricolor TaxID=68217 RepID=UPI0017480D21|nr:hypothetical protein [Kitasatospora herbaricolor]MDQ0305768.1 ADP-ribose pyrophosphatase YjhB (NUDIX family) [Kitasatospora herbaricolor]GGV26916.1 hypothetical protein GCM10010495_48650 [Kitasatospora herbaricolor]
MTTTAPNLDRPATLTTGAGTPAIRAELLITAFDGRILLTPAGSTPSALPGGTPLPQESPAQAAARHAAALTGLARLDPAALLTVDWYPDAAVPRTVTVHDHPPLTNAQLTALTADRGHRGALRLVTPTDLATQVPGDAERILTALRARIDGACVELQHGRPRTPRVLDIHQVAPQPQTTPEPWTPLGRRHETTVTGVAGWLFAPTGLVLLHHDPVSGRTRLPGGPLSPADGDDLPRALARICATTVATRPAHAELIGHRGAQARLADVVRRFGPLVQRPCEPAVIRLLATPEQAAQLCDGSVDPNELRAALDAAGIAPGLVRQPVTALSAEGLAW